MACFNLELCSGPCNPLTTVYLVVNNPTHPLFLTLFVLLPGTAQYCARNKKYHQRNSRPARAVAAGRFVTFMIGDCSCENASLLISVYTWHGCTCV